jgi:hypothetical protein
MVSRYDRFFYHSFPKPTGCSSTDDLLGTQVVELICELGFLLTPEVPDIDEAQGLAVAQTRFCMTELHPSELPNHALAFGNFSLEFYPDPIRQLGAMPVIYIPNPTQSGRSRFFDETGVRLVKKLEEIQTIFEILSKHEKYSAENERKFLRIKTEYEEIVIVEAGNIRDFLQSVKLESEFIVLSCAIRGLSSLFYLTDNKHTLGSKLDYYRQREWRIISDLVNGDKKNSRPLTQDEAKFVVASNPAFFEKPIQWTSGVASRISLCQLLTLKESDWPKVVRRLLVPAHLRDKIRSLKSVRRTGIPIAAAPRGRR